MADRDAPTKRASFAELDEDPDSILLSEVELGQSDESTSSTIIGGKSAARSSADSDIQLAQPKHDSDVDSGLAAASDLATTGGGLGRVWQAGLGREPDVRRARHPRPGNAQCRRQRHLLARSSPDDRWLGRR